MQSNDLRERTRAFAIRIVGLADALPNRRSAEVIARQVLRSATSIGANYRSARRGRSRAEFLSKLGIAEEEADETAYWLELLAGSGLVKPQRLEPLLAECNEITAMIVASIRTARRPSG